VPCVILGSHARLSIDLTHRLRLDAAGPGGTIHAIFVVVALGGLLPGCKEQELTREEIAFQQKFDREAVLVKTCGGSGPDDGRPARTT
jgi:hypothetical protein